MVLNPSLPRDERGAAALIVAITVTVLAIMAALVVDLGLARDTRRSSQNAADASALAGANALYPAGKPCSGGSAGPCAGDAVSAVKTFALANFNVSTAEWSACTATPPAGYASQGGTSCIAFDSASSPRKVWVRIPTRNTPASFAGLMGRNNIAVSSQAEAQIGGDVNCTLCFLGDVDAGNGDFSVYGGAIAVNGNVDAGPNSYWTSAANGVVGSVNGGQFTPSAQGIAPFADPFADFSLPLPTSTLAKSRTDPCETAAKGGGPGIYTGNVAIPNKGTCTLQPGLYVISGAWSMKNNSDLRGTGVTLYVKNGGSLDFKNGDVDLSGHAPQVSPEEFVILYDRDNTSPLSLQGNGKTDQLSGAVYLPSSKLDFNGNSCFGFSGGPVVVTGVIKANGNKSCVTIRDAVDKTVSRTRGHLSR